MVWSSIPRGRPRTGPRSRPDKPKGRRPAVRPESRGIADGTHGRLLLTDTRAVRMQEGQRLLVIGQSQRHSDEVIPPNW